MVAATEIFVATHKKYGAKQPDRVLLVPCGMEIRASEPSDLPQIRELFIEYARGVGDAVCFRTFEAEVAGLPGVYSPPGEILVASDGPDLVACVALRPLSQMIAEMKRLYVRPAFRSTGIGRSLVESIVSVASARGFEALRLDTLPTMTRAITLYRAMGFCQIPPYGNNPPAALCFEKSLKFT